MYIQTKITKLLVDLDGTLYDIINGYEEHVRQDSEAEYICTVTAHHKALSFPSSVLQGQLLLFYACDLA